jgi:hypothetical protein
MAPHDPNELGSALADLAVAAAGCRLPLDLPGASRDRAERDELTNQIRDYLLPRLRWPGRPLLAVVGGSTGSGKSTLVNSLVGEEVSPSGVLRPTTRSPVVVCHPDDEDWFREGPLLPELPRASGRPGSGAVLHVRPVTGLRPGAGLLDAPDIDSVEEANRELATQLLAAADLWLFVTTAVRYADAVPWEFLTRARDRGTTLEVVVNRIPPGAQDEITADLQRLLDEFGLGEVPVHAVLQQDLTDGLLSASAVRPVAAVLAELAGDPDRRAEVARASLEGALSSVRPRVGRLVDAVAAQERAADELRRDLEDAYGRALGLVAEGLESGAMLRAEVLERWQELIGTGELMRALHGRLSRARDRLTGLVTGRVAATEQVTGEITSRLERLLVDVADRAALDAVTAWRHRPGGPELVAGATDLERASAELRERAGPEIRAWQDAVLDLVRSRGQGKRATARVLALGVNSVGVALMIVLFSSTGGLTGGEVAIASGTATVSQALLTALFGEQAVRELAQQARRDLLERVRGLLDADADRFRARLEADATGEVAAAELADLVGTFDRARRGRTR